MPTLMELKDKALRLRVAKWLKRQQLEEAALTATKATCQRVTPCYCRKVPRVIRRPVLPTASLALIAPAPPKNLRNHDYNLSFEQGRAKWYHLPVASVAQYYTDTQITQIGFCALGITSEGMGERSIRYVWRVKSVQKLPRHMLTVAQSGTLKASDLLYWLFEFEDEPILLSHPVTGFPQHFALKLGHFSELIHAENWSEIVDLTSKEIK